MAKFGHFQTGGPRPLAEFEGDYMVQEKEYVNIRKRVTTPGMADEQVAAIRLKEGDFVKKISD